MSGRTLSRAKLLGLFAVFAIPLGIATGVYMNADVGLLISERGTTNRGGLIEPVKPVDALALSQLDGGALPSDFLTRRWTMLLWNGADCDLYCEANLFKMRQARLILGKYAARVKMVYLLEPGGAGAGLEPLKEFHPALQWVRLERPAEAFSELPTGKIYIVDPLGNLMMSYPKDAATKDVVKDMKWLLKVSKIG